MEGFAIIPARMNSTRFVGKPLAMIDGLPMVQHVYQQCAKALRHVYVATDDDLIAATVAKFGGKVLRTTGNHESGTSRCAEAAATTKHRGIILNVQCDEPYIQPAQLLQLLAAFDDPAVSVATLIYKTFDPFELADTNTVKVVTNNVGDAMYFSRGTIPWGARVAYKHIGVYAYRRQALAHIATLPPNLLEHDEGLEQLRWMAAGLPVRTVVTDIDTVAINTPDQL